MPDDKPLSGPLFSAAGLDGMRCFSRDGITWSNIQTGREGEIYSGMAFGNGRCVASARFGGSMVTAATENGIAWRTAGYDAKYSNYLHGIVYFNHRFLGIGGDFIMPSADGVKWEDTRKTNEPDYHFAGNPAIRRFAIGNNLLVGVGDYGVSIASKDGLDWTFSTKPIPANTLIDVAFGNGVFVGGGMHGLRMRSTDGLNWTDRVVGEEGEHINSIIHDGKQFVGIGQGATYISPDSLKWERIPNQNAPTAAAFGNGDYVGSLWPGKMMRSTDGITWKQIVQLPKDVACLGFGVLGKA